MFFSMNEIKSIHILHVCLHSFIDNSIGVHT